MADGGHPNGLLTLSQLIEDPIRTDPQRAQAAEFAVKRLSGARLTLEEAEGVLDCVDQRPVELEQLAASAAGEDEPRQ